MKFSYLSHFSSIAVALILFLGMVAACWAGSKLSRRLKDREIIDGFGAVEGSLLGLLALLLAFTFSMAAARYDARREVLVNEANNIGTAVLRADLYSASERTEFRSNFREYVEARIAFYEAGLDEDKVNATTQKSTDISARIWAHASLLAHDRENLIPSQHMIPALNDMIDIVTTRSATRQATVPDSILWMLFALCCVSSLIVGFSRREKEMSWTVTVVFALMISSCVFLIVDLDRPSQGFITLEEANKNIVELRRMFDQ